MSRRHLHRPRQSARAKRAPEFEHGPDCEEWDGPGPPPRLHDGGWYGAGPREGECQEGSGRSVSSLTAALNGALSATTTATPQRQSPENRRRSSRRAHKRHSHRGSRAWCGSGRAGPPEQTMHRSDPAAEALESCCGETGGPVTGNPVFCKGPPFGHGPMTFIHRGAPRRNPRP